MITKDSTPKELLTYAAQLMRERANAATPSGTLPAGWSGSVGVHNSAMLFGGPTEGGYRMGTVFRFEGELTCDGCDRPSPEDIEHIQGWHPDVALAVADLLDVAVRSVGFVQALDGSYPPFTAAALRIARAYLSMSDLDAEAELADA